MKAFRFILLLTLIQCSPSGTTHKIYLDDWQLSRLSGPQVHTENSAAVAEVSYPKSDVYRNLGSAKYALYRTKFTIPEPLQNRPLVFAPGEIDDADIVWLNGTEIGRTGNIKSENNGKGLAYDRFRIYNLPAGLLKQNNELIILVRTHFPNQGGIYYHRPVIGDAVQITEDYYHAQYRQAILAALFQLTGLYFLLLYVRRRKGIENLAFFCTATLFAVYFFFRTHLKYEIIGSVILAKQVEFASLYFMLPVGAHFMLLFFHAKEIFYRIPVAIAYAAAVCNTVFLALPEPSLWFDLLQYVSYPSWILAGLSSVALTIHRALQKTDKGLRRDAVYLGAAFSIAAISAVNDALYVNSTAHSVELSQYGFLTFVAGLGWILSNRFVRLHEDIEDLNTNLEKKVDVRTRDLKQALDQIDLEMQLAGNVQSSLLPESVSVNGITLYGYNKPSATVGGDIYDAFETSQGTLIYLADASGHGVPAALITMLTRTVFQNEAKQFKSLPDLLNRVNRELIRHIRTDDYITCTALLVHPDGMAELASAGHLPGYYLDKSGIQKLETKSGFFLGMLDQEISFDTIPVDLTAKQRLLLYTDGFTEARLKTSPEEEFGFTRLETLFRDGRFLSAKDSLNGISSWVIDSCLPFKDDATLVIVERSEPLNHAEVIRRYAQESVTNALQAAERAIRDSQCNADGFTEAARAAMAASRPALAFHWMNIASKRWPDHSGVWSVMGDCLARLSRQDLAEKAYRKSLRKTFLFSKDRSKAA